MKIELLKSMAIDGKHCAQGSVVEVSDLDGNYLVSRKHAQVAKEEPQPDAKKEKSK